jgi:hypothetical protein
MPQPLPKVTRLHPPPPHLGEAGKAFWIATIRDYQVETGPLLTHLEVASGALDRLSECRQVIKSEGLMITEDGKEDGKKIAHPLLKVESASRAAFQSAMRALRLQPIVKGAIG